MRLWCQSVYTSTVNDIACSSGWSTEVLAKNGGTRPAGALKFHPSWRGTTLLKKRRGGVGSGWCWYWWYTIVSVFGTSSTSSSGFWSTWHTSVVHISTPTSRDNKGGVSLPGQVVTVSYYGVESYHPRLLNWSNQFVVREHHQLNVYNCDDWRVSRVRGPCPRYISPIYTDTIIYCSLYLLA